MRGRPWRGGLASQNGCSGIAVHVERAPVRHVVAVTPRRQSDRVAGRTTLDGVLPLHDHNPPGDPPLPRPSLETVDVTPAVHQRAPSIVVSKYADVVALDMGIVTVEVDVRIGDVPLVGVEGPVCFSEELDEAVDPADIRAVILDRVGVVRRPQQVLVATVDTSGVAVETVDDGLSIGQRTEYVSVGARVHRGDTRGPHRAGVTDIPADGTVG